jgi:RNA-directed DNA polymerase
MSPELLKVVERAKKDPEARMYSLARLIDPDALKRAFARIRQDAAVGVDGITKEQYGQQLAENIQQLHGRLKAGQWRHRPIRRVHIPKAQGKTRPIGISCIEEKVVQGALTEVLEAIYEQDFLPCSYGFRRGRSAHDALRALNAMVFREGLVWILEADIQAYFDSLDRNRLKEILQLRIADQSFMRLIGKCLHVGILDGEEFSQPDEGTVQGSVISPVLGNVYLHHVLDQWFENAMRPHLDGRARLIRYCDDFVMGFERREDAELVLVMLHQRMANFRLKLHPEKTRLLDFRAPNRRLPGDPRPPTFDFLGFTAYWRKTRKGSWSMALKTRKARMHRALQAIGAFCRCHRHDAVKVQYAALWSRLNGHFNYFGVNGNSRSLQYLKYFVERQWHKWLNRRSQRRRLNWKRFHEYLVRFPLPRPTIRVQIWAAAL